MKATTFMAVVAILLVLSCQKTENITANERNLNLEAPSGKMISPNISSLKISASNTIASIIGKVSEFEITNIEYAPLKKGIVAVITYKLADGTFGNYISVSGLKYELLPSGIKNLTVAREQDEQKFTCEKLPECTTECKSKPVMIIVPGGISFDCGCDGKCRVKEVKG